MSEREITENSQSPQSSGFSWHTALFVTLLSLARIAHGFFWAIPGPTLPSLELNVRNRDPRTEQPSRALVADQRKLENTGGSRIPDEGG